MTLVAWRLEKNFYLVICNSPQRVYILRRPGVAVCLACVTAAAVDRQARVLSCLAWRCEIAFREKGAASVRRQNDQL